MCSLSCTVLLTDQHMMCHHHPSSSTVGSLTLALGYHTTIATLTIGYSQEVALVPSHHQNIIGYRLAGSAFRLYPFPSLFLSHMLLMIYYDLPLVLHHIILT
jgi:hypothetical protein